jgi:hypothetical protein
MNLGASGEALYINFTEERVIKTLRLKQPPLESAELVRRVFRLAGG